MLFLPIQSTLTRDKSWVNNLKHPGPAHCSLVLLSDFSVTMQSLSILTLLFVCPTLFVFQAFGQY